MSVMDKMMVALKRLSLEEEADHVGTAEPLVGHLGLGIEEREPHESYMWDGTSFNSALPDRHIYHDIAHWLVATPERRGMPEFGLGPGPETDVSLFARGERFDNTDEIRAALLGALLQHEFGLPCGLIADEVGLVELIQHAHEPNAGDVVDSQLNTDWLAAYIWLEEGGLIGEMGVPTVVADMRDLGIFPDMDGDATPPMKFRFMPPPM